MGTPFVDTSIRTTGADSLQSGLLNATTTPRRKESFDAHLNREVRTAKTPDKPARKPHREESSEDPISSASPTSPPITDVNSPPQYSTEANASAHSDEEAELSTQPSEERNDDGATQSSQSGGGTSPTADNDLSAILFDASAIVTNDIASLVGGESAAAALSPVEVAIPVDLSVVGEVTPQIAIDETSTVGTGMDDAQLGEISTELSNADETTAAANAATDTEKLPTQTVSQTGKDSEDGAPAARTGREHRKPRLSKDGNNESTDNASRALEVAASVVTTEAAESTRLNDVVSGESTGEEVAGSSAVPTASNPDGAAALSQSRLAQHLVARGGDRIAKDSRINEVDQSRFVDRVARAVKSAENRQDVVRLRLHPPELGSLRVELRMQQGIMTARLEAETPAARTLLADNVQALRDRLTEQGVRVESFDVDLMDRRSPDDSRSFEQQQERDDAQRMVRNDDKSRGGNPGEGSVGPARQLGIPGQLNVIV